MSDDVQNENPCLCHFKRSPVQDFSTENRTNNNLATGDVNDNALKESDGDCLPESSIEKKFTK